MPEIHWAHVGHGLLEVAGGTTAVVAMMGGWPVVLGGLGVLAAAGLVSDAIDEHKAEKEAKEKAKAK
jgi:hypothetical protein